MSDYFMVKYSDDHGNTWSAEQWLLVGEQGDNVRRFMLDQQGSALQRIYETTFTGNRSYTLLSMHGDLHLGI